MGTNTPHQSAILELKSTNKGFLVPRMTKQERDLIANPIQGLIIYCTNCTTIGINYYENGKWNEIEAPFTIGDIKKSIKTSDHDGWILLNGRSETLLSSTQKTKAQSLNLIENAKLLDASDAFLAQPKSTENTKLGKILGSNTLLLHKDNIPSFSLTSGAATESFSPSQVSDYYMALIRGNLEASSTEVYFTRNPLSATRLVIMGGYNGAWVGIRFYLENFNRNVNFNGSSHSHINSHINNSQTAIDISPRKKLFVNMFVYLGE